MREKKNISIAKYGGIGYGNTKHIINKINIQIRNTTLMSIFSNKSNIQDYYIY
jgi:hypothetical protein